MLRQHGVVSCSESTMHDATSTWRRLMFGECTERFVGAGGAADRVGPPMKRTSSPEPVLTRRPGSAICARA